jgi:hypothetical protein
MSESRASRWSREYRAPPGHEFHAADVEVDAVPDFDGSRRKLQLAWNVFPESGFEFRRINLCNRGAGKVFSGVCGCLDASGFLEAGLPGWEIGRLLSDFAGSEHV